MKMQDPHDSTAVQVGTADLTGMLAFHEAGMRLLARILEEARSGATFEDALTGLVQHAVEATGSSMGSLLVTEDGGRKRFSSQVRMNPPGPSDFAALLERARESTVPLELPAREEEADLLGRLGADSLLLIPLDPGSRLSGVLALVPTRGLPEIDPRLVDALGSQLDLGIALADSLTKLEQTLGIGHPVHDFKRDAEEIRLLHSITDAINGAGSLTAAFSIVLDQLCRLTGWRFGQAWIREPTSEELVRSEAHGGELAGMEPLRSEGPRRLALESDDLLARTVRERRANWFPDLHATEGFARAAGARAAGLQAGVWVPVHAGEEIVAVLEFFMPAPRDEDGRWIEAVAVIGTQLGFHLRRKAAEEAARARAELAELTSEIGLALTSAPCFADAMSRCTDGLVRYLEAADARIWMLDDSGCFLDLQSSSGREQCSLDSSGRIVIGESLVGRVAESRAAHMTNDVQNDPWVRNPEWVQREQLVAFVGHPLIVDGKLVGVLALYSRRPFDELVIETLRPLSDMIALAIRRELLDRDHAATQAQLQQAQKMEAIGQLAGGVAHDFNNILSVILGYSELALEELQPGDPLAEQVHIIRDAGERATELTRRLLAFSRKQVLEPRPVDINVVVKDLEKMLRRLIGENITLLTMLDARPDPILADPGQLEQVIMNLVVNARDAMPSGGKLTLETAETLIDENTPGRPADLRPGPYVQLVVKDTGCGMDSPTMARIFEPFFTTKPKDKGTGLGLSTVYGIVRQSGGQVTVSSDVGKGTTFRILLPRAALRSDESSPAERTIESRSGGTETILVVEDEAAVRALATRVLARCGYLVLDAANGGEALLLCERHHGPIHLLLSDVVMPMMSGIELHRRLRRLHPRMRVLFMSGYAENELPIDGPFAPGVTFMSKPFMPAELERKVRAVLDQEAGANSV